jgi:hypothetical protein
MQDHRRDSLRRFFASPTNLVLITFLAVGGFYMIAEHWAHVVGAGPLIMLLLLCGGMHLFMHAGHGGHGSQGSGRGAEHPPEHRDDTAAGGSNRAGDDE